MKELRLWASFPDRDEVLLLRRAAAPVLAGLRRDRQHLRPQLRRRFREERVGLHLLTVADHHYDAARRTQRAQEIPQHLLHVLTVTARIAPRPQLPRLGEL